MRLKLSRITTRLIKLFKLPIKFKIRILLQNKVYGKLEITLLIHNLTINQVAHHQRVVKQNKNRFKLITQHILEMKIKIILKKYRKI